MRYAEKTSVPADRSRSEIERILRRYGAHGFGYGWDQQESGTVAVIAFKVHGKQIRFVLPLPDREDKAFTLTPTGRRRRSEIQAEAAYEQATRQRWRALALAIKAKLEVVEAGIQTLEEEFLAYIVMPDGLTVGQHVLPRIEDAYLSGNMPNLLLTSGEGSNDAS